MNTPIAAQYEENKAPPLRYGVVSTQQKGPGRNRGLMICDAADRLFVGAGAILERGAQNVPQGRARVGGAVLRDGFLLLGHFQRLDRDLDLSGLLVELD